MSSPQMLESPSRCATCAQFHADAAVGDIIGACRLARSLAAVGVDPAPQVAAQLKLRDTLTGARARFMHFPRVLTDYACAYWEDRLER